MSNAIVSLMLIAMMLVTGMGFAKTAFNSVASLSDSYKTAEQVNQNTSRTEVAILKAEIPTGPVNAYVLNAGQVNLANFPAWDVLVHYYSDSGIYYIRRLPCAGMATPGANQWGVISIYANQDLGQTEVFEPGILDPGEVAEFQLNLSPQPGVNTMGWIVLSTPSGVPASIQFQRRGV